MTKRIRQHKGVLEGNWSGYYYDGVSPSSWSGSVKILRQWKSSGFQPVRYGQCWVFAGVLTTVLRCLGFPARMISNFSSGHDTNTNLRLDTYYRPDGSELPCVEWFTRSDLGAKYNGWQILDATPQEQSSGVFQCGPASLVAIKEGDVDLNYECPFIFGEVNADIVTWTYDTDKQKWKKAYEDTRSVGKKISTKALGSFTRLDVTDTYKYSEGSSEERETFQKARDKLDMSSMAMSAMARPTMAMPAMDIPTLLPDPPKPRVTGKFEVKSRPEVGQDVELVLQLTNLAPAASTLTANMNAWTIVYTGKPIHEVWKDSLALTLGPQEEKAFPIKISYADYQKHLTTDNVIQATAVCQVKEGADTVVLQNISLENPTVTLKASHQESVSTSRVVQRPSRPPPTPEPQASALSPGGPPNCGPVISGGVQPRPGQVATQYPDPTRD
uniref:Transglutaminase-like domain-containing protein n=1 Tax=Anolis carolinensis TaxID=28377 RepID=A0A803T7E6_ANOCA